LTGGQDDNGANDNGAIVRTLTANALWEGLTDGRLDALLAQANGKQLEGTAAPPKPASNTLGDIRKQARDLLINSSQDGSLTQVLGEAKETKRQQGASQAAAALPADEPSLKTKPADEPWLQTNPSDEPAFDEVRSLTRSAISQGLVDGRLDSILAEAMSERIAPQDLVLVPQPPAGTPGGQSPVRNRRLLGGSSLEKVMQMVSDCDRKAGSLQVMIAEAERQLADRDVAEKQLAENIQLARADVEHLSVDLQWHEEQINLVDDRSVKLNEDRRGLALKLDEMRLNRLKDEWPVASSKPSYTGCSWTSTVTGGGEPTAIEGNSAWNTDRSAAGWNPVSS